MGAEYLFVLRLLRAFRIFKILRKITALNSLGRAFVDYKEEYGVTALVLAILLTFSSTAMYYVEGPTNPGFDSLPKAFWWSVVTFATVGYGDVYPTTAIGKTLAGTFILLGPIFTAMISSITIIVFFEVFTARKNQLRKLKKTECPRCLREKHDADANYCKICGESLRDEKTV